MAAGTGCRVREQFACNNAGRCKAVLIRTNNADQSDGSFWLSSFHSENKNDYAALSVSEIVRTQSESIVAVVHSIRATWNLTPKTRRGCFCNCIRINILGDTPRRLASPPPLGLRPLSSALVLRSLCQYILRCFSKKPIPYIRIYQYELHIGNYFERKR